VRGTFLTLGNRFSTMVLEASTSNRLVVFYPPLVCWKKTIETALGGKRLDFLQL
jgi:hypothetical protein